MKGFRTLAISAAITVGGLIEQSGMLDLVPDHYKGLVIAGIGMIMAVLRFMTSTAPFKSLPS